MRSATAWSKTSTDQPPALLLIPAGTQPRPDPSSTRQALHDLGLIGQALSPAGYYTAGNSFLDHISFLGCSPDVKLDPGQGDVPGDGAFIHVSLLNLPGAVVYRQGRHPRPPLCPDCRKPVTDFQNPDTRYICRYCDLSSDPVDLIWRDGAVVSRDAIEIIGIYPSEAVPTDHFISQLNHRTKIEWRYIYL